MQLSRRDFLKLSGTGLSLSLASGIPLPQMGSRVLRSQTGELGILYDPSRCIGCRACQMACKQWNKLPGETTDTQKIYETPLGLSANTWTLIKLKKNSQTDWHFFSYQCMHCTDAACVTVCPTAALFKDERGFVAFDRDKCNGCGYCTRFCPFGVPHVKGSVRNQNAEAAKCTFCQDRIWGDLGGPSCAEACPVGALVWGQRKELLDKGKERVATLRDQGLSGARLYGENEARGLHRLSILLDRPSAYGLPVDPQGPITFSSVWQKIVQPLGEVAVGATILGLIVAFFVTRRNIRMEEVE